MTSTSSESPRQPKIWRLRARHLRQGIRSVDALEMARAIYEYQHSIEILVVNIDKLTHVEENRLPGILFASPTPRNIPIEATMKIHKIPLPRTSG